MDADGHTHVGGAESAFFRTWAELVLRFRWLVLLVLAAVTVWLVQATAASACSWRSRW